MKKFKKGIFLSLVIVLVFSFAGCSSDKGQEPQGKIIAEYEGGSVGEVEFNNYLGTLKITYPNIAQYVDNSEAKKELLKMYIAQKYLLSKVDTNNTYEDEAKEKFVAYKDKLITSLGSEQKYKQLLKDNNLTDNDLVKFIQDQLILENYYSKIYFDKNQKEFTVATVSHILVSNQDRSDEEAKARAEEVLAKLNSGGDFSDLAKEYSDDPGSKDKGGVYENVPVNKWVPEFKKAVMEQNIGQIGGLVKSDYGYHIIKVIKRDIPKFEDLTEDQKIYGLNQEYNTFMTDKLPNIIKSMNIE